MGGVGSGAAGGAFAHVGAVEERVDERARGLRSDAEECGHHDGQEGAAEVDAAGKVLLDLLCGSGVEEGEGVDGGSGEV